MCSLPNESKGLTSSPQFTKLVHLPLTKNRGFPVPYSGQVARVPGSSLQSVDLRCFRSISNPAPLATWLLLVTARGLRHSKRLYKHIFRGFLQGLLPVMSRTRQVAVPPNLHVDVTHHLLT